MSRSGYSEDCDCMWLAIMQRGAVASAIRGKRGQSMLRELLDALDAMPEKRLIAGDFVSHGEYCALGVLGLKRGIVMEDVFPRAWPELAKTFDIAEALAREIMFMNDAGCDDYIETPEDRWQRMREWIASLIKKDEQVISI